MIKNVKKKVWLYLIQFDYTWYLQPPPNTHSSKSRGKKIHTHFLKMAEKQVLLDIYFSSNK